ncbi:MAG: AraC family transcriptional regulator [Patulibacter sp.]|nr:AraC family transcriptional regulator [Patulibacter sp.]
MDLLADVLAVSGVRGTVGARIEAGSTWGYWLDYDRGASFHAVTAGTAWLAAPGSEPFQLMPGDVVLLPRGTRHLIASDADTAQRSVDTPSDPYEQTGTGVVRIGHGDVRTHILCASYAYDPAIATQVLPLLPDVVHVRGVGPGSGLDDTVRLLGCELARPKLATAVILDRLVDILLVQLLRVWLEEEHGDANGSWLGALGDPVTRDALARIHDEPARPWTTETLAAELAVSRATLTRRFRQVVGMAPAAYVAQWRMDLAARRLRDTDDTLESIARAVGYTSVYAFSRAFSRARAQPPGRFRATARAERLAA